MRFEVGVWDSERRAVFVASNRVGGGGETEAIASAASACVESIDIATGAVRWRAPCSGQPVALTGAGLVVVDRPPGAAALILHLLDAGDGTKLADHRLPLPSWTALPATVVEIEAVTQSDGSMILVWHGTSSYGGGAPPPPEVVAEHTRDQRGAFRIDLEAGSVGSVPAPPPAPARTFMADASGRWWAGDASGAVLAEGRSAPGERAVALVGDTLLSLRLEPAAPSARTGAGAVLLIAREPSTAQMLWQHRLRDLTAPPPPAP